MSYTNYTDKQLKNLGYVIHVTKSDFVLRPASSNINLIQDDQNLAIIKIILLERSKPFKMEANDIYEFKMGKIDHTFVWVDIFGINEEDHAVYIKVVNQMCTIPGRMLATVKLTREPNATFPVYSEYNTYSLNDIVLHNGDTYECIIPVEEPEEFDPDKWRKAMFRAHSSLLLFNIQKNPIDEHDIPSEVDIGVITDLVERAETAATGAEISEQHAAASEQAAAISEQNAATSEQAAKDALDQFEEELDTINWFNKVIENEEIDALFT